MPVNVINKRGKKNEYRQHSTFSIHKFAPPFATPLVLGAEAQQASGSRR